MNEYYSWSILAAEHKTRSYQFTQKTGENCHWSSDVSLCAPTFPSLRKFCNGSSFAMTRNALCQASEMCRAWGTSLSSGTCCLSVVGFGPLWSVMSWASPARLLFSISVALEFIAGSHLQESRAGPREPQGRVLRVSSAPRFTTAALYSRRCSFGLLDARKSTSIYFWGNYLKRSRAVECSCYF